MKNNMDFEKAIDDFRQLQGHRKRVKKFNKTITMSYLARVKIEENVPQFWVQITFTEAQAIIIRETNETNALQLYRSTIYREEIETYNSEYDQLEINFFEETQKSDVLIIFENTAQRIEFETAFRHFMEYSNPEVNH
jgi:predicted RNA-binding protein Jag